MLQDKSRGLINALLTVDWIASKWLHFGNRINCAAIFQD
jgi:hypothetical protein